MFLRISQNSQGNTCSGVSFLVKLKAGGLQLYEKNTPIQVWSCELCEIFKNTFFIEKLRAVTSKLS